jgi:hypothetical protein
MDVVQGVLISRGGHIEHRRLWLPPVGPQRLGARALDRVPASSAWCLAVAEANGGGKRLSAGKLGWTISGANGRPGGPQEAGRSLETWAGICRRWLLVPSPFSLARFFSFAPWPASLASVWLGHPANGAWTGCSSNEPSVSAAPLLSSKAPEALINYGRRGAREAPSPGQKLQGRLVGAASFTISCPPPAVTFCRQPGSMRGLASNRRQIISPMLRQKPTGRWFPNHIHRKGKRLGRSASHPRSSISHLSRPPRLDRRQIAPVRLFSSFPPVEMSTGTSLAGDTISQ